MNWRRFISTSRRVQRENLATPRARRETVRSSEIGTISLRRLARYHRTVDNEAGATTMTPHIPEDSSLSARKQLAQELHYTGDTNDSAAMNIWLHKQVMTKLAENGGKVPDDLKH
jgi:hypothetical protein